MNNALHENRQTSYLRWSRTVAIALTLILLVMWWMGYGPFRANCCTVTASASTTTPPAVVATPAPTAAPAPLPAVATPVAAAPAVDSACANDKLNAPVSFHSGSDKLSGAGQFALNGMIECLGKKSAQVIGHTDNIGAAASNLDLSGRRAQAVKTYLIAKGVPAANLQSKGVGDAAPVADNANANGRAQNRRIEIKLNP